VSFAVVTLYVASQQVFIVVVDFVIDSVQKLLDNPHVMSNINCVVLNRLLSQTFGQSTNR
jgi:hypothetical protein